MLVAVCLHRPRYKPRTLSDVRKSANTPYWKERGEFGGAKLLPDFTRMGTALIRDFYEAPPPGSQKNPDWLNRSRNTRRALEIFWRDLEILCKAKLKTTKFNKSEVAKLLGVISYDSLKKYNDSVLTGEEMVVANIHKVHPVAEVTVQETWSISIAKDKPPHPKIKTKTRPVEIPPSMEDVDRAASNPRNGDDEHFEHPKRYVTRRAYNMLELIFPDNAEESCKGINWDDFVHAMSDLGFKAMNGGGSAVVFENNDKIIFHKPHPSSNIDPVMLHSMGKRMAKWFGRGREVFALKSHH
ncbi:hypothetical protein AJ79_02486 [Helicocarpus griseus UAMH5409]|uniref:Type II toxin-antitoxin system HicA family toxin n=1 Tax=Helicocarpus griseus UAMH5409 TaxID=1447875 RepID=A0A2B7Y2N5_9EURO|nr:hypothetical protein AJ79_02486 [Helicocarpus griseus UAMH5409]